MDDPKESAFESDRLDPDDVLWVRGVDYVAGWRAATDAAAELVDALSMAGVDAAGVEARAETAADGSGVVRLRLSAVVVRNLGSLLRDAAAWREAS